MHGKNEQCAVKVNAILQNKENYSVERECSRQKLELVLNRRVAYV